MAPTYRDFRSPVDIANRALQHCGRALIDDAQGFAEQSKNAAQTAFAYPKLRKAELRRNTWKFAIREAVIRSRDISTMRLSPALWMTTTSYFAGSIVIDQDGMSWISRIPNNLGNDPLTTSAWEQYFGPQSVMLYDSTLSYFAGELVYTTVGDGTYRVYQSRQSNNSDNPATATAWDATVTYMQDQVITYSSVAYKSRINLNINQIPTSSPANWASGTTYAINNLVTGSDGVEYRSLSNGNIGHDPTADAGVHWQNLGILTPWTTVIGGGTGSLKWLQIGGAEFPTGVSLSQLNTNYPLGAGPSSQTATRNTFLLPAGFLRLAPQDPKAGSTSWIGAPSGLAYTDWLFEGEWLVSRQFDPIRLRFITDVVDVTLMDPMFCEGLGARLALEVCEPLTQSTDKLKTIASEYDKFMSEARTVNAIEIGAEEAPMDDWIAARF